MKIFITALFITASFISCKTDNHPVVENNFIDSVIVNYVHSSAIKINAADSLFWKSRMSSMPPGFVNEQKYAATLTGRFHLFANMHDLVAADSIMHILNINAKEKEAGILRTLATLNILQHRFNDANENVIKAVAIGSEKYASLSLQYDVAFELGQYQLAEKTLSQLKSTNEYGYFFRKARQFHFLGEHDSSIVAMQKALELAAGSSGLQQSTLSNLGDLHLHAANVNDAYDAYKKSLQIDPADLHSLTGMAWIALIHDRKDSIAEKIIQFVKSKNHSPEPYLKLSYIAEQRQDSVEAKRQAETFAAKAGDPIYGNMYNKYLVDVYTGVLSNAAAAKAIAQKELSVRKTAQTFSWYAWSLFKNNEEEAAYKVYKDYVAGKSLEGLELYYMGMMMSGMNKQYNAKQYFKAAYKNRYDLSPAKMMALNQALK